eukprot:GEMP01022301.1.p1 GENE.GEMP01022301.1~~GEMP01022301.1.p1  ORF type:complete len:528 (+),score=82.94 GEMP01022301.1:181-1764(+)
MDNTIFVSLASYRDPEVIHTVRNLFSTAAHPERVFVGLCLQNAQDDTYGDDTALRSHPNVRIIDMDYREARGPSYARAIIQQRLFSGEHYYLQLDSHSRMVSSWDEELIRELAMCAVCAKPILTTYPASYEVAEDYDPDVDSAVLCSQVTIELKAKDFFKGNLRLRGCVIDSPDRPLPGAFWAAGFSFSSASVIREVPYPSDWMDVFFGEEEAMGAMLWTHGWDFFSPTKSFCFHLWSRRHRHTFWELERPTVSPSWKNRIGGVRTLSSYSKLTGVDFDNRRLVTTGEVSSIPMLSILPPNVSANILSLLGSSAPTVSVRHESLPSQSDHPLFTEDDIHCFNTDGFVVIPNWASRLLAFDNNICPNGDLLAHLRGELGALDLRQASVGDTEWVNTHVRGDKMTWIRDAAGFIGAVENSMKKLVAHWDKHGFSSSSTSLMAAWYPGNSAGYARHLDVRIEDKKKRRITMVFFPNERGHRGGALRVHFRQEHVDISAEAGNLVVFSSPSIEHEVLPTHDPRWTLTMWVY